MNVAILILELFLNSLFALMEQIGLRTEVNGQTIHTNQLPERLFSLIGKLMEKLTTLVLFRNARMELSIPLKETQEILAEPKHIVLDLHLYMATVSRHIKKDGCSV